MKDHVYSERSTMKDKLKFTFEEIVGLCLDYSLKLI